MRDALRLGAPAAAGLLAALAVELLDLALGPRPSLVAAPAVPRLPALALLVPRLALLVGFVALEVRDHAADRVLAQVLAVREVARARDADLGHASLRLGLRLAHLKRAPRVRCDSLGRLGVHVLDGLADRGLKTLALRAHRVRDGDGLILRIALLDQLRNLRAHAVAERVLRLDGLASDRRLIVLRLAVERPYQSVDRLVHAVVGRRLRGRDGRAEQTAERRCRGRWRAAERLAVDEQPIRVRVFDRLKTLLLPRLVGGQDAALHIRKPLARLLHLVALDGVVVGEERVVLDAEQGKERLVEHLLVHAARGQDGRLLPRCEAHRRARKVRIVRAQHRDGHAEDRGDLLNDLLAALQVLRRERQRLEVDVAGHGEELASALRAADLVLHLRGEPVEFGLARVTLDDGEVVGTALVLEEEVVHLVQRLVGGHRTPRSLDLAEAVVHIARVRVLEMHDLVGREVDLLRVGRPVSVALDERLSARAFARHDLRPLARHRPQFGGHAETAVDHRVDIGVASEFKVKHAQDGRVEAVLVRVDPREKVEQRVPVGDGFVVVAELRGLRHREPRWELREVAGQIRLRSAIRPARVPELRASAARPDVQPKRLRRDGDRVQPSRGIDPRRAVAHRRLMAEVGTLHVPAEEGHSARAGELRRHVVGERRLGECRLESLDQRHMALVRNGFRARLAWTASASAHTPSSCPAVASYETCFPEYRYPKPSSSERSHPSGNRISIVCTAI